MEAESRQEREACPVYTAMRVIAGRAKGRRLKMPPVDGVRPTSDRARETLFNVLATEPGTRAIARDMMVEAQPVGEGLGVRFAVDVDRRIDGAARVGAHRTSMLQDLERGRPLENDALVGAVQELGRLTRVPTPTIDLVHALLRRRAASRD